MIEKVNTYNFQRGSNNSIGCISYEKYIIYILIIAYYILVQKQTRFVYSF